MSDTQIELAKFKVQLSRFTDRPLMQRLGKVKVRYFNRAGGAIRTTAKRLLRKAPQKPLSELTPQERTYFEIWKTLYARGDVPQRPRRPERIAKPGRPPLLHTKPKSPLRELIFYFVAEDGRSVVIGPSQFRSGNLRQLENRNPFMGPAMAIIEPKLPSFLASASQ